MQIRYIGPIEELDVVPAGRPAFSVRRGEYVDVPSEVVGHRPKGDDLGDGLLAQGEYVDGEFQPLWELESVKKAQKARAANDAADSGEKE